MSRHDWSLLLTIVRLLVLGGRNVADGLEQPAIVEPVDPFERRVLHVVPEQPLRGVRVDVGDGEEALVAGPAAAGDESVDVRVWTWLELFMVFDVGKQ